MRSRIIPIVVFSLLAAPSMARAAGNAPSPEEASFDQVRDEARVLREQVRMLQSRPVLTREVLEGKIDERLQDVARDVKAHRESLKEIEDYVKWLSERLGGYAAYVQAGSVLAGVAKVLPVPYAGQASVITKFVSQGVLSLNSSSASLARYLDSTQGFVSRVESLKRLPSGKEEARRAAVLYADQDLLKDMLEARDSLETVSGISASALSFLQTLNHYVGSTDEYWSKTKSLLKRGDAEKKEKSYLSEAVDSLEKKAGVFSKRLKQFGELVQTETPQVKSVVVYQDLLKELDVISASPQQALKGELNARREVKDEH